MFYCWVTGACLFVCPPFCPAAVKLIHRTVSVLIWSKGERDMMCMGIISWLKLLCQPFLRCIYIYSLKSELIYIWPLTSPGVERWQGWKFSQIRFSYIFIYINYSKTSIMYGYILEIIYCRMRKHYRADLQTIGLSFYLQKRVEILPTPNYIQYTITNISRDINVNTTLTITFHRAITFYRG